jgi:hypothetical protein
LTLKLNIGRKDEIKPRPSPSSSWPVRSGIGQDHRRSLVRAVALGLGIKWGLFLFTDTPLGLDMSFLVAYLDPGLGSMQLQIAIAGLLSATIFLKSTMTQVKGLVGRCFKKAA